MSALVAGALVGTLVSGRLTDYMLTRGFLNARVSVPAVCYFGAAAAARPRLPRQPPHARAVVRRRRRDADLGRQPAARRGSPRHHASRACGAAPRVHARFCARSRRRSRRCSSARSLSSSRASLRSSHPSARTPAPSRSARDRAAGHLPDHARHTCVRGRLPAARAATPIRATSRPPEHPRPPNANGRPRRSRRARPRRGAHTAADGAPRARRECRARR